jgi:hypothetical protein
MKKFCSGDIVPGWPPVFDALHESTLQEALAACLFQPQTLPRLAHEDDRRSNLQEANAA